MSDSGFGGRVKRVEGRRLNVMGSILAKVAHATKPSVSMLNLMAVRDWWILSKCLAILL
jgi:hypothetical protein